VSIRPTKIFISYLCKTHAMRHGTRRAPAPTHIGETFNGFPLHVPLAVFLWSNAMSDGLRSMLESIKARDPAARSLAEVALLYPGVRALAFHRAAHALWRSGFLFLGRFVSELGRWLSGIEIHPGAVIGRHFFIDHGTGVVIGETAIIGDNVTLYHGVTLGGIAPGSMPQGRRHPVIEDDVIIGAGAQILGGLTVGKGARVGANAVVVKDVPPGVTVVGIPAQVVAARGATKPDFLPYGSPCDDLPDPTSRALCGLLNEVEALRRRVTQLEAERGDVVPAWPSEDVRRPARREG
jgi:serine O-acetyltransferase